MAKSFWEVINKKDRSGAINYRNNNISIDLIINKNNFSNDTVMKSNNVGESQTVFLFPKVKFANHGLKALPYFRKNMEYSCEQHKFFNHSFDLFSTFGAIDDRVFVKSKYSL